MFEGEKASLEAILSTDTIRVPKPVKVVDLETGGAALIMEHIDMKSLNRFTAQLAQQLADFHLHNKRQKEKQKKEEQTVGKGSSQAEVPVIHQFGFHVQTCCGFIPQLKIPAMFADVEVEPALLHGDLWSGNIAECTEGPLIFDPASFYGHAEFELGIAGMFGGFGKNFYRAYHEKIPKEPGFDRRHQLYQLFHYLNHWNHFGTGYRGSALRIMKELSK
ncbi:Ketosamine-3-kinase [Bagarius yarrelli]|uniref:protein-ribulosamine 3-kinase n=1 Tax=Bagarius yarrelli TaxID=175774 RepID=A0A556VUH2_BAGYA|nr:Ketosamine-3-kinase [Bagarius yarrelli]